MSGADFARIISAVSGFFFWGMIELVEQNASSRLTKPVNAGTPEDQLLAKPAHSGHHDGETRENLQGKVP